MYLSVFTLVISLESLRICKGIRLLYSLTMKKPLVSKSD